MAKREWYEVDELVSIYLLHKEGLSYRQLADKCERSKTGLYNTVGRLNKVLEGEPDNNIKFNQAGNKIRKYLDFRFQSDFGGEELNWSPEHQEIKELPEDPSLGKVPTKTATSENLKKPTFTAPEIKPGDLADKATNNINDFLDVVKSSLTNMSVELATAVALDINSARIEKTKQVIEKKDSRIKELEAEVRDLRKIRDTAKKVNIGEMLHKRLGGLK